jgi:hypothetical protein
VPARVCAQPWGTHGQCAKERVVRLNYILKAGSVVGALVRALGRRMAPLCNGGTKVAVGRKVHRRASDNCAPHELRSSQANPSYTRAVLCVHSEHAWGVMVDGGGGEQA